MNRPARPGSRGVVRPDRPAAIAPRRDRAARRRRAVAGKGHEDYQIIGTVKHHLDDREEVERALARRGA
jgi:UDP-N-acetylmuramoyl-L-alanyl-D-glutamate--2,6-diaminopimelate ligase